MDKLTAETITDEQIGQLCDGAHAASDYLQVALCYCALGQDVLIRNFVLHCSPRQLGDIKVVRDMDHRIARQFCADAINSARAQETV